MTDWNAYRNQFPVTEKWIYLNHGGFAPIPRAFMKGCQEWLEDSLEEGLCLGDEWEEMVERCRSKAAKLIGSEREEAFFVRNTSHGLSLFAEGLPLKAGDDIMCFTSSEYPSNVYPWQRLADRGINLVDIPLFQGRPTLEALEKRLTKNSRALVISSAQYGSGAAIDVSAWGAFCAERDLYFCLDAIQTLGAYPLDVRASQVSCLAADSHKWLLGAPGIGIAYVEKSLAQRMRPALVGWKSMVDGWDFDKVDFNLLPNALRFEEGSAAYGLIYGLERSLDLLLEIGVASIAQRINFLVERLATGFAALGWRVGPTKDHRAGIVTVNPPGSADLSSVEQSQVLQDWHDYLLENRVRLSVRRGHLRFSPHFYNNEDEIDQVLSLISARC